MGLDSFRKEAAPAVQGEGSTLLDPVPCAAAGLVVEGRLAAAEQDLALLVNRRPPLCRRRGCWAHGLQWEEGLEVRHERDLRHGIGFRPRAVRAHAVDEQCLLHT
jgi:hypothetical protein